MGSLISVWYLIVPFRVSVLFAVCAAGEQLVEVVGAAEIAVAVGRQRLVVVVTQAVLFVAPVKHVQSRTAMEAKMVSMRPRSGKCVQLYSVHTVYSSDLAKCYWRVLTR